jgi:phosphatidylinositol N-acetylglucosaminyltransferase subunit C
MADKLKWRKLLWVKQPYPDNHVDTTFLSQLKRNQNVQPYSFWILFCDSSVILIHLCSVAIFALVFLGIYNNQWNPLRLATISTGLSIAGYGTWDFLSNGPKNRVVTLKSTILILFTLLALSPVLKSLTQSTSSDSIWSLTCWLCLANVLFSDYSFASRKAFKLMLSTNLALAAAIVLASRMQTTLSVFCFVVFSVEIFGVLPVFAHWVRTNSQIAHWLLLTVLVVATNLGLFLIGGLWALVVWLLSQLLVMFIFPGWFLELQKYKNEIQGPWDPAKPVIRTEN